MAVRCLKLKDNHTSKVMREYSYELEAELDKMISDSERTSVTSRSIVEIKKRVYEIVSDYDSMILSLLEKADNDTIINLIRSDSELIRFIENPTHEMQSIALKRNYYLASDINNITESNIIYAIYKSEGYVFQNIPTHCQTVKSIKVMVVKYKEYIGYGMIYPPLLLEPSLKKELEELRIKELGSI